MENPPVPPARQGFREDVSGLRALNLGAKVFDPQRHGLKDGAHRFPGDFRDIGLQQQGRQLRKQGGPLLPGVLQQFGLHPEIALRTGIENRLELALERRAVREKAQDGGLDGIRQLLSGLCPAGILEPCLLEELAIAVQAWVRLAQRHEQFVGGGVPEPLQLGRIGSHMRKQAAPRMPFASS